MDTKIKMEFFPVAADGVLDALATVLKGTAEGKDPQVREHLRRFRTISVKIKKRSGGVRMRIKIEGESAAAEPPAKAKRAAKSPRVSQNDYKQIKKRLQGLFAGMGKAFAQNHFPATDAVAEFVALAERMAGFPGGGDPHYAVFTAACRAMEEAVRRADPNGARERYAELKRLKAACHRRCKK